MPGMHRVGYLVNTNLRDKFFGYQPSDHIVYAGELILDSCGTDDAWVCEEAFRILNLDDRPFGQTAPSLSVGDVVAVSGGGIPGVRYYTCARSGFAAIDTPIETFPRHGETCADELHWAADRINAEYTRPPFPRQP